MVPWFDNLAYDAVIRRLSRFYGNELMQPNIELPKGSGQHPLKLLLGPLELEVEQCHRAEERKQNLSWRVVQQTNL
jgi:hypothetical protein